MIAWILITLLGFLLGVGAVVALQYIEGNDIPKTRGGLLLNYVYNCIAGGFLGGGIFFVVSGMWLFIRHLTSLSGGV